VKRRARGGGKELPRSGGKEDGSHRSPWPRRSKWKKKPLFSVTRREKRRLTPEKKEKGQEKSPLSVFSVLRKGGVLLAGEKRKKKDC